MQFTSFVAQIQQLAGVYIEMCFVRAYNFYHIITFLSTQDSLETFWVSIISLNLQKVQSHAIKHHIVYHVTYIVSCDINV